MLELEQVRVNIGKHAILRGVSLMVPSGQIAGLVGRNGAGKTTTLRSIMGLVPVRSGTIRLDDQDLLQTPAQDRARLGIGYMPEDRRLIGALQVRENILLPLWATQRDEVEARLDWVYRQIPEIREFAERRATQLSGGQQKMVALARALVIGSQVLLLDEPFEGLAADLSERLGDVIRRLGQQEELAVLIADSDAERMSTMADRTYIIERGQTQEAPRSVHHSSPQS